MRLNAREDEALRMEGGEAMSRFRACARGSRVAMKAAMRNSILTERWERSVWRENGSAAILFIEGGDKACDASTSGRVERKCRNSEQ